jgi:hypothetical protein
MPSTSTLFNIFHFNIMSSPTGTPSPARAEANVASPRNARSSRGAIDDVRGGNDDVSDDDADVRGDEDDVRDDDVRDDGDARDIGADFRGDTGSSKSDDDASCDDDDRGQEATKTSPGSVVDLLSPAKAG